MGQNTAILDIGSSKVICLICGTDGRDNIIVQGAGIKEYPGYKRGAFSDEQLLSDAIVEALGAAEAEARHRVRDISVGVPAPFTRLVLQRGEISFKGKSKRISHRDIDEVINASLDFAAPEGYSLIHSTPVEFSVQEAVRAEMPIGVMAEGLSATVSHLWQEPPTRCSQRLSSQSYLSGPHSILLPDRCLPLPPALSFRLPCMPSEHSPTKSSALPPLS